MLLHGVGSAMGRRRQISVVPPDLAQLYTPTLIQASTLKPPTSGTVSINGGGATAMVALPLTVNPLILGQSNARGAATDPLRAPIPGVSYDAVWSDDITGWPANIEAVVGQASLAIRASDNTHGVEFGVVEALQQAGYTIGHVGKYGVGSASLSSLAALPAFDATVVGEVYDSMISYAQAWQIAGAFTYNVVFWLQGEADANTITQVYDYHRCLDALAAKLRVDLGNPNLIVVSVKLGASLALTNTPVVNDAMDVWSANDPALNRVVDSDVLAPSLRNGLHWTSSGYDILGELLVSRIANSLDYTWSPTIEATTHLSVSAVVDGAVCSTSASVPVVQIEPTDIANLKHWWDGLVGIVGNPIDSWTDKVGSLAITNTTTGRPDPAVGGGFVADAAIECLKTVGVTLSTQRWLHTTATVFIVLDRDEEVGTRYVFNTFTSAAASVGFALFGTTTGRFQVVVGNGSGVLLYTLICQVGTFPVDANTRTIAIAFDAVDIRMYINGALVGKSTPAGVAASGVDQQFQLNAGGSTSRLIGTQREIVAFDRKLSATEVRKLHGNAQHWP